jgi:hypothetical protein
VAGFCTSNDGKSTNRNYVLNIYNVKNYDTLHSGDVIKISTGLHTK